MSDVWPSADEKKKRVLILADSHGRNISAILSYVLRRKREVLVIFKPNATLGCVAEDIDKLTTSFTMADVVVLIGGTNDLDRGSSAALVSTVEGLQRRLQHRTQLIVATLPRRYDNRNYNRIIDELNERIRDLRNRYEHMKILELGDMGKDYHTNQGLHLNIKGKIKLCLKLCKEMDSSPRACILRPPMRMVADFLKLFTLPDGHRFNYESPRTDDNVSYMNTVAVSRTPREKLQRVKLLVIDIHITVPSWVGKERGIAENLVRKPLEIFLGPSGDGERRECGNYSNLKCLRTKKTNCYWAQNTFCVYFQCRLNNTPPNLRMGHCKAAKLLVTGSKQQILFIITESGLLFSRKRDPAVIILNLDAMRLFSVDENKNFSYVFEQSTVEAIFSKRVLLLELKIRSKISLQCAAAAASCVVMTGTHSRIEIIKTSRKQTSDRCMSTFHVNAEGRPILPQIIILDVTFGNRLFTLRLDVVVFRPILIASSHEFVLYFLSSDHVEIAHCVEFFVINNASLVQYVRLPLSTYVFLSICPKELSPCHDNFGDSRIVPYNDKKTLTDIVCSANQSFRPLFLLSLQISYVSLQREPVSNENEPLKDDVILTDSMNRVLRQCLFYLKFKYFTSNKAKIDATNLKKTRQARNGSVPEITKQLTKVTTTYLSCCGDFNSTMITRSLKSEGAKDALKEL